MISKNIPLLQFRPSLKSALWQAWYLAKGLSWMDAGYFYAIHGGVPKCYICGREKDFLFNFTKLINYYDASIQNVVYICYDHGRVTNYDCTTGEPIELPLPKPYWQRNLRNIAQATILNLAYSIRFIWFISYDLFMWYVAIYFYFWYKELRKARQ